MCSTLRSLFLLIIFLNTNTIVSAQDCRPEAFYNLNVNNVNARINTGGDLFFDGANGTYEVSADATSPSAIFLSGLWMGGKDSSDNLHLAAQSYGRSEGNFDYVPGPLDSDGSFSGNCNDWDQVFTVTREDVDIMREFANNNVYPIPIDQIPLSILGWPGSGNPYFESVHGFPLPNSNSGLAPFWDTYLIGYYNPASGSYPLFLGDEASWTVMHDAAVYADGGTSGDSQIKMETQVLAYAYNSENTDLSNTTFYEYKFIYHGEETLSDFYYGQFIDTDLGCSQNDLMGTAPDNDLIYFYNDADNPEYLNCEGEESYGTQNPVNTFRVLSSRIYDDTVMLNQGLQRAIAYSPLPSDVLAGVSLPTTPEQRYLALTGHWRDGTPLTAGGNGYNPGSTDEVDFIYSGNYDTNYEWSLCNEPGSRTQGDLAVYSFGPLLLRPGAVNKFTVGITTFFDGSYLDGCVDLDNVLTGSDEIQTYYQGQVDSIYIANGEISSTQEVISPEKIGLQVYPNPASETIQFKLPETATSSIINLRVLNLTGQTVAEHLVNTDQIQLNRENLPAGIYLYQLLLANGKTVSGRLVWQ